MENDNIIYLWGDPSYSKNPEFLSNKMNIIEKVTELKFMIDEYNNNNNTLKKHEISEKLKIIQSYFRDIIDLTKKYYNNIIDLPEFPDKLKNHYINNFNISKEDILGQIESIDTNVLSISILKELFSIKWLDDIYDFVSLDSEVKNQNQLMKNFDAQENDIKSLQEDLNKYWSTEYFSTWNPQWPVLVIFPEIHNAWDILKNNFEAMEDTTWFYNFISTEGLFNEINLLKNQELPRELIEKEFTKNKIQISSIALELLLTESINTIWIENSYFADIFNYIKFNKNKSDIDYSQENNLTYLEYINLISQKENPSGFIDNVILKYRNYFWLKNIWRELTYWNYTWKNFVPLVCWYLHSDDLIAQSKNFWFKGVIKFTWESYNKKLNKFFMKEYSKGMNIN